MRLRRQNTGQGKLKMLRGKKSNLIGKKGKLMYVMSYSRESRLAVFLAKSKDAFYWEDLNQGEPVIEFPKGVDKIVRDPFLMQDRNGLFHLLFTDNWRSTTIAHCTSDDFLHWSEPDFLPVMGNYQRVLNCWAPECFWDEENQNYVIIWSSRFYREKMEDHTGNHIWCCTTKDFKSFGPPKLFFDPGYVVIDASVLYYDGVYYMAFKDERGFNRPDTDYKALRTCRAVHAMGPYEKITPLLTRNLCEGPAILRKDGKFIVFYDSFGDHTYRAMESADFIHFTDITPKIKFPPACKHLTVIEVEDSLVP